MPLSEEETAFIKSCFDHRINQVEELSAKIAKALSSMTHYTTAVMTRAPREEQVLSHLQLVPISDRRLLLVLVTKSGAVRQSVLDPTSRLRRTRSIPYPASFQVSWRDAR